MAGDEGGEAGQGLSVGELFLQTYPKIESVCMKALNFTKTTTHWLFVPAVILIGIRVSEPKPSLIDIFSPF